MDELPFELLNCIFSILAHRPTFLSLTFVSKKFHLICSKLGKILNISRIIAYDEIVNDHNISSFGKNDVLEMMKWARATFGMNGSGWDKYLCEGAARWGYFELLMGICWFLITLLILFIFSPLSLLIDLKKLFIEYRY